MDSISKLVLARSRAISSLPVAGPLYSTWFLRDSSLWDAEDMMVYSNPNVAKEKKVRYTVAFIRGVMA
jgi:hypothetical protein